jgi:hypothetical protein
LVAAGGLRDFSLNIIDNIFKFIVLPEYGRRLREKIPQPQH